MRPHYIFLLLAAKHGCNAGPRRRDLNWGMFGFGDQDMHFGSYIPITDDYGSDLAFFDAPATDSSETGDINIWGDSPETGDFDIGTDSSDTGDFHIGSSSDYPSTLDETGTDISSGDWIWDTPTSENPDIASSTYLDPFGSDYISNSGCSSDTMVSGKVRRDDGMCLTRPNDITEPKTKPETPNLKPPLPPAGPGKDPDWLKFFPKPEPENPNQVSDPRFERPPEEPEEIVPTTDVQGPCAWPSKYLCCELNGQPPPVMSSTPIPDCVQCM